MEGCAWLWPGEGGRGIGVGWYFWLLDVKDSLWSWWNPVQLWFQLIPSGSQESRVIELNLASNLWQPGLNLNLTAKHFWPGDLPGSSDRTLRSCRGWGFPWGVVAQKMQGFWNVYSMGFPSLSCLPLFPAPLTSHWTGWHHWHFWATSA